MIASVSNADRRDAFAAAVRAALAARGLGVRDVGRRSRGGISHTSVLNMLEGHLPGADMIVEFAEAVTSREGPRVLQQLADRLLALAGKRVRYCPAMVGAGVAPELPQADDPIFSGGTP